MLVQVLGRGRVTQLSVASGNSPSNLLCHWSSLLLLKNLRLCQRLRLLKALPHGVTLGFLPSLRLQLTRRLLLVASLASSSASCMSLVLGQGSVQVGRTGDRRPTLVPSLIVILTGAASFAVALGSRVLVHVTLVVESYTVMNWYIKLMLLDLFGLWQLELPCRVVGRHEHVARRLLLWLDAWLR